MANYISTSSVFAVPEERDGCPGYRFTPWWSVHTGWMEAYAFETTHLALGADATRITRREAEEFIRSYTTTVEGSTVIVCATLQNGFRIVESAGVVESHNFSRARMEKLALEKIKNKTRELLGFLLATALNGVGGGRSDEAPEPSRPEPSRRPRLFVSTPMKGLSREVIAANSESAHRIARDVVGKDLALIDSYFPPDIADSLTPLGCLGKSLELLAQADYAIFYGDWESARGCCLEYDAARSYGIPTITFRERWGVQASHVEKAAPCPT
jgi:hypothetical protein